MQGDGEVREPDNSTVDDWFGQNVARDAEVADKAAAESDDATEAEEQFEREADGQQRYEEGHPRPDGAARA
ncbi:MAG: hypothetical protein JWM05_3006 [Acidimicrobiales bacterium]|nr:hypothetical protein [Acidimicrobiales bacterium]